MKIFLSKKSVCFRSVTVVLYALILCQGCHNGTLEEVHLPPTNLMDVDLKYGERQVDKMMRDRPEMAKCVGRSDVIYIWAVRQFAGEVTGQRIYWSSDLPQCGDCLSDWTGPGDGDNGFIRINSRYLSGKNLGQDMPCEELWACVVYELYNMTHDDIQRSKTEAVFAGISSKQEWVETCVRLEFDTKQKTKQFYKNIWQPWAQSKGLTTDESKWYVTIPDSYETWAGKSDYSFRDLNDYFSKYYDEEIASHLRR